MKLSLLLITISAVLSSVCAFHSARDGLNTNARRLARGLSPLPPVRRATGVSAAKRSTPSSKPHGDDDDDDKDKDHKDKDDKDKDDKDKDDKDKDKGKIRNSCNGGTVQCCNSVTHANERTADWLSALLGIVVSPGTAVGFTCHPLSVAGVGGGSHCSQQPVCCQNNQMHGAIVVGCSPININAD